MPFLPPNQQRQSTEGTVFTLTTQLEKNLEISGNLTAVGKICSKVTGHLLSPVLRILFFFVDEVLAWLSVWSDVQMISVWSSGCHWHPIISCFIKIFLMPACRGCPGKEAVNACLSVKSS